MNKILDKQNYHFIGIGGIGISAIARMLILQGKKVSGSDSSQSEITDDLEKLGVKIFIGQKAENIGKDTEVVIYTVAIPENNPEMQEARKREREAKSVVERTSGAKRGQESGTTDFAEKSFACFSYPETLGELSREMQTIAISGTHGKTTTTAMIGHILEKAGLDPTIIVGSKMLEEQKSNFKSGKSKLLVVEACEYKRSFLNLYPSILIITNIEADHLDYYKDLSDIQSAFKELAERVPANGFIITDTQSENIKPVIKNVSAKVLDYKEIDEDIELLVPGKHNISNAKTAIQAVKTLEVGEKEAKQALKNFVGTWRRLEYKGEKGEAIFYDDYAHHPSEIQASLSALKGKYPEYKLICIFEPHQQKRTKDFFDDFVKALQIADRVFIAPIYVARETKDDSISNKILAEAVNKKVEAKAVENLEELIKELKITPLAHLTLRGEPEKICIVFMGAGDIYKWTPKFIENL